MPDDTRYLVGSSTIPSPAFLNELRDNERRDDFVADQVRIRLALMVRALREQRGWSQADLGRVMDKLQPNISRIEDPDYGKLSLQTLFELASAFGLPLYIDMPEWDDWFRMMSDMSNRNLQRQSFNVDQLASLATYGANLPTFPGISIDEPTATMQNGAVALASGRGIISIEPKGFKYDLHLFRDWLVDTWTRETDQPEQIIFVGRHPARPKEDPEKDRLRRENAALKKEKSELLASLAATAGMLAQPSASTREFQV